MAKTDLFSILKIIYLCIVIISLVSFFSGLIWEINNNKDFVDAMTCNKTSYNHQKDVQIINGYVVFSENNKKCDQMESITKKANNLIFFVILFWIYLLRKDFYDFFK